MFSRLHHRGGRPSAPVLAALVLVLTALGCRTATVPAPPAPPSAAELAFARAVEGWREGDLAAARDAAESARALAPDWIPPRRLLDDLARRDLRGPEALARHAVRLDEDPRDPTSLYLAGRLDGTLAAERSFLRAVGASPDFSWGHHGLAWARVRIGDFDGAIAAEHRALALAATSFERAYFAESLARHYASSGRETQALEVLYHLLGQDELLDVDRRVLSVRAAAIELLRPFGRRTRDGARRALELLREGGLTEGETRELAYALARSRELSTGVTLAEVRLALRSVDGPGRERLAAEIMLRESPTRLALALLERSNQEDPSRLALDADVRAARLAAGDLAGPIDDWLALQPGFVKADDGLPRDPALARMVTAARRAAERPQDATAVHDLGEALLDAGWFVEARGLAQALASHDVDLALALDDRATAGRALVTSLGDLVHKVDTRQPLPVALPFDAEDDVEAEDQVEGADLEGLLAAIEPRFQSFRDAVARAEGSDATQVRLASSPRLSYGPAGSIVHPGPRFSAMDEELGIGREGDEVLGLAREFDEIGRFAVFGQARGGGGPDGTVLRRLLVERREGEHFGVPWSGTIAWCDGADLRSRPGRRGARIGGAAVHEGYWIDVATLRAEWRHFRGLHARFVADGAEGSLQDALDVTPLPRSAGGRGLPPLLGEADRVRLAILRDRRGTESEHVTLDELALTTATHEEGHLCDRTRYFPLSSNLFGILAFFASSGFSAAGVEERLEYRAQLTALCETPEARLPLAEVLSAAEGGSVGLTPHAAAYTGLLEDFVEALEDGLDDDPQRWSHLDPSAHLAHQLHRLTTEEVRAIGYELARREGLTD